jgi:hypothetical protein
MRFQPTGAIFSGEPVMYFQKLKWIIEEALAAHRPNSYSALFFETALSAFPASLTERKER